MTPGRMQISLALQQRDANFERTWARGRVASEEKSLGTKSRRHHKI